MFFLMFTFTYDILVRIYIRITNYYDLGIQFAIFDANLSLDKWWFYEWGNYHYEVQYTVTHAADNCIYNSLLKTMFVYIDFYTLI